MTVADGLEIAHALIAKESVERTGRLDLSNLGLVAPPEELRQLTHLHWLRIGNRPPWEKSPESRENRGENTLGKGLAEIAGLANLQELDCMRTQVTDLTPLKGLTNLQFLDCSETRITDLTPLAGLANLQSLYCWETPVTGLTPLKGLANLESLSCARTQITDLTPLKGLANLQFLDR